jgi:hypothetical protein
MPMARGGGGPSDQRVIGDPTGHRRPKAPLDEALTLSMGTRWDHGSD